MVQFVKRIGNLREQIVFPKVEENKEEDDPNDMTEDSLFRKLGQETGLRNIIEIVIENSMDEKVQIFQAGMIPENQACMYVTKLTSWLTSLMEPSYKWQYDEFMKT